LALDEPTNHLDIPAREVLEEALREYDGTVLVVSHDRYFLDRVVTKILHLDPATGRVVAHVGNYTDWKQRVPEAPQAQPPGKGAPVARDAVPGKGAAGGVRDARKAQA